MLLKNGVEVDAGTPFDFFDVVEKDGTLIVNDPPRSARIHPDTDKNPEQRENQRILEGAVMRAALASGTLIMPLEDEHWDFRFPTNEQSLKFALKSIARIIRVNIPEEKNIDTHSYDDFKRLWAELFSDHNDALLKELGTTTPPKTDPLYSIDFYPLMDTDLPPNQQMTDGRFKFSTTAHLSDHGLENKVRPPSAITKK